jgi:endonuclease YncB( thermonuclease family)
VIDGDTIRVYRQRPDVRLVGVNAPETRRARCDAQRELGGKATRRLRQILRTAVSLDLRLVPCVCSPGTSGGCLRDS